MNVFYCNETGKDVCYSVASVSVDTINKKASIPGLISCSDSVCESKTCPLEKLYSDWLIQCKGC
jgi:hypothetical protein